MKLSTSSSGLYNSTFVAMLLVGSEMATPAETNDKPPFVCIFYHYTYNIMVSMVHSTDDFSAREA